MSALVRYHCPFVGLHGCQDGRGKGLTKSSLLQHFKDWHYRGEAMALTRQTLSDNLTMFSNAETTLKRMGVWICGVCLRTHTFRSKCRRYENVFVEPPDYGDGLVRFIIYDIPISPAPSSSVLSSDVRVEPVGWSISLLDRLFSIGLRTVEFIPPKCCLGFARVLKGNLDDVGVSPGDLSCWIRLLVLHLCVLKTFSLWSNLQCRSAIRRLRQEESVIRAILAWGLGGSL
ncbi:unnamed protein product [Linum trigynum]|uniref:Uncharacterized protein n=1 Tax=Linum trigynum TaxID=586398 RepID=A0AAV2DVV0_9ROSI